MELVILGSGTCFPAAPGAAFRYPPLFALNVAGPGAEAQWVVFDCSEGARWRLGAAGIDPAKVEHLALSHPHADHAALPSFMQARACTAIADRSTARPLHFYLPRASAEALPSLWAWHQPEDGGRATSRFPLVIVPCDHGSEAELWPGVRLGAFAVHHGHGKNPALAFRVEAAGGSFAYSGDSGICEGLSAAARGVDLFLCEASARVGDEAMGRGYGHLNPRQAAELATEAGAKLVVLTHYSGADPDEAMLDDARSEAPSLPVQIAHDGERIVFGAATGLEQGDGVRVGPRG
ncbi:MAG: MBL fold metallo-hydrolase [Polyangiaceae bacterium]|jgi:ribonuclease BN (tRNA processing enzyme)|nr:MBL fold metallo-hydrolase [Polyangiaceae bacterium]